METAKNIDVATALVISTATPVDCGGGRVAFIRPHLTPLQIIKWLGRIPETLNKTIEAQQDPVRQKAAEVFARENPEFSARWLKCMLAESVVALDLPYLDEGQPSRRCDRVALVDKPQSECEGLELSLSMFDEDADFVNAVLNAVNKSNGWTEEAAESGKYFLRGPGFAWLLRLTLRSLRPESAEGRQSPAH